MYGISLRIRNYKSFKGVEQGFNSLRPINILIGKNNSGKSTLLDLVSAKANPESMPDQDQFKRLEILLTGVVTSQMIDDLYDKDALRYRHSFSSDWEYAQQIIGKEIVVKYSTDDDPRCERLDFQFTKAIEQEGGQTHRDNLAGVFNNPLKSKIILRIAAERNIKPEGYNNSSQVTPDGEGVTNVIQRFLNESHLPSDRVEETILQDLNEIFGDDGHFERISTQHNPDGAWEVYLHEKSKGAIKLSSSGSGLKTILQVLVTLRLQADESSLERTIFAFEELENNLHPGVLRRLYFFIDKFAQKYKSTFFITTHSSVVIDMFSTSESAQIVHLTHDGESTAVNDVLEYMHKDKVFNDLDIRASDLLQSNSIIWVEGPSDVIYMNKWIELWSNGELRQGAHYQCICYGGSLVAYLYSSDSDEYKNAINTLKVNRNAIILMDSDKRVQRARLSNTKRRIIQEVEAFGGIAWATLGKEIENYLAGSSLAKKYSIDLPQLGQFELMNEYLDRNVKVGEGQKFQDNKVQFASEIVEHFQREELNKILDLDKRMDRVVRQIKAWNKIKVN